MKVALVHDYIKEPGGAEAVLAALKEIWPEAPVYTAYAFPKYWGRYKNIFKGWDIRQSWGRYLPLADRLVSYYTILSPWFFKSMDLSGYDAVIVSQTGGYFPNGVNTGGKTKLITYCHTPPRFLYGYETATKARYKWYWRPFSIIADHVLLMVDYAYAQKPDLFIANSKNVANRIRKFYRREAKVVYPPIEVVTPSANSTPARQSFYLIISRIVGSKNIELAVAAANKYKFNLKIAGRPIGTGGREIAKNIKGETVEYLGEVSEDEKIRLMQTAKGFLALEKDADFGMTAVEPQAYGLPVIAYRNGGYLEAVIENKSGIFFDELTADGLGEAIRRFNKLKWKEKELITNANRFAKERFKKEIFKLVSEQVKKK